MKMLEIKNLSKNYGDSTILDSINLEIANNEFVCLVGPSGCGKSTLLNIIAGFEKPSSGLINNKTSETANMNNIMVFQDFNQLFPWLTVRENICFALEGKLSKSEQVEKSERYLGIIGLKDYADYYPNQLSGGQKQRVAIARSLIGEPEILCMDEPFASLDIHTRAALQKLVIKINKEFNTTIIFVTHDLDEAVLLSDRIIVMNNNPATIVDDIENNIQLPRDKYSAEFRKLVDKINYKIQK